MGGLSDGRGYDRGAMTGRGSIVGRAMEGRGYDGGGAITERAMEGSVGPALKEGPHG